MFVDGSAYDMRDLLLPEVPQQPVEKCAEIKKENLELIEKMEMQLGYIESSLKDAYSILDEMRDANV
jgi:hypothetical protein